MKKYPFLLRFLIPSILFIVFTVLSAYHFLREIQFMYSIAEEKMESRSMFDGVMMSSMLEHFLRTGDMVGAEKVISQEGGDPDLNIAMLIDDKDTILYSTRYELKGRKFMDTNFLVGPGLVEKARGTMARQSRLSEDRMVHMSISPITLNPDPEKLRSGRVGVLYLEHDLASVKKTHYAQGLRQFYEFIIVLGMVCLGVWGFSEWIFTRRIKRLVVASRSMSEGNYEVLVNLRGRDELAYLGQSFDDMAGKIIKKTGDLERSIEERKHADNILREKNSLLRLLRSTAVAANEAVEIDNGFQPILEQICHHIGWPIGHVYLVSEDDPNLLEPSGIWHLETPDRFDAFRKLTVETKFVKGCGLPGQLLASGRPYWFEDITNTTTFVRAVAAKEVGIKSGFAFPVKVGNKVVAVLEFFGTNITGPDQSFLEILTDVGTQLGRVVERKKAEETLRENEIKYRSLFEAAGDSIFIARPSEEGKIIVVDCNEYTLKIFGCSREEIIGKGIEDFSPNKQPDGKSSHDVIFEATKAVLSGNPQFAEFTHRKLDGTLFDTEVKLNRIDIGKETYLQAIIRDVTGRKKAENEMKKLRNLLKNIIDSMPSILIGVNPDGKVTQWNHEAEIATGISSDNAVGQLISDVYPQMKGRMVNIKQAILNRAVKKDEKIVQEIEGKLHYYDFIIYPLVADGIEGAVIRIDDITERMQIEEMMVQSEKMMSVGGLAAGMAHEINNPLSGILLNIQVVLDRVTAKLQVNKDAAQECGTNLEAINAYMEQRKIVKMLKDAQASGQRAAKIVANMLSFSRKSSSNFAPHNIIELLEETIDVARNDFDLNKKYDFRRIKIERLYAPDIPILYCERSEVQQVFLNLFKNSAEAMDEEERKQGPLLKLHVFRDGNMIQVEVEDNGPGMDENIRKHVFEPFYTTKEVGVGTGLGLSVSYFIITKNHDGTMSVESSPGKGTKFIVRLPHNKR